MLGKRTRLQSIVPNPTTCFISDWNTHTLALAEQPSTSRDSKMSHVVFYTVLGDGQHSLSPKTPANTCGFALNRSGTFTCKRPPCWSSQSRAEPLCSKSTKHYLVTISAPDCTKRLVESIARTRRIVFRTSTASEKPCVRHSSTASPARAEKGSSSWKTISKSCPGSKVAE